MKLFLKICVVILFLSGCSNFNTEPKPMGDDEEANKEARERWFENMHRAAPGTNWKTIEATNKINALAIKQERKLYSSRVTSETFAAGLLTGTWEEKGPNNNAGRMVASSFDSPTNTIYNISDGGVLWKGTLVANNWTILNDDIVFGNRAISVFNKTSGGRRLMVSFAEKLYWSDDEGATFTMSTGPVTPIGWGGNYFSKIIVLNDASKTIYALARNWNNIAADWNARHTLYISTDQGVSFSVVKVFNSGADNEVCLNNPYNSNLVYVTDVSNIVANRISLYEITGSTVTTVAAGATAIVNGGQSPLAGTVVGTTLTLYCLVNNNKLYRRTKNTSTGVWADWTLRSTTPINANNVLDVSTTVANNVYFGGVDAYKSTNGGSSFTIINGWASYYGAPATQLHADIFEMKHFKKADNSIVQTINCDGGVYSSTDNITTVTNLSMLNLNNSQSYDILTDTITPSILYDGSQDQGLQRIDAATTAGKQTSIQIISGDWGYLTLTKNNSRLWSMYPGNVYYCNNPSTAIASGASVSNYTVPGTNLGNVGWMLPIEASANKANNFVYVGGGNTSGGGGSYLLKLTGDPTTTAITATQFAYDFRANSNSTTSSISALEVSLIDANKLYVAAEDGTFFYSNDNGITWVKSTTFTGLTGYWLYGQSILASKQTSGLVWYGGSGYGTPGVYKSTNGGTTFTAINTGLPSTLINELAANNDESMLFAATDAGPYVYIVANDQWYPMIGANTPLQVYRSVEYIRSSNTVRFATYGRGVFDFVISSTVLPITGLNLKATALPNKNVQINFTTETEIDNDYFEVQRSTPNNNTFDKITTIKANGNGNSNTKQHYQTIDNYLAGGNYLYRIKQVDKNGKIDFSNIIKIAVTKTDKINVLPNPVSDYFTLSQNNEVKKVKLLDQNGKLIKEFQPQQQYSINSLPAAIYFVQITTNQNEIQN
ncbi:MAG: T9SS type A sorting domain-containing protein, partial [Ferruginibacter sp.]